MYVFVCMYLHTCCHKCETEMGWCCCAVMCLDKDSEVVGLQSTIVVCTFHEHTHVAASNYKSTY